MMENYLTNYIAAHKAALDSISIKEVEKLINYFKKALEENRQIFVFGNGGSGANASHFITDLGKGASDKLPRRFRGLSLNDNVSWMTAIGNDYSYDDVFLRQLENYAQPNDIVMMMSVSGNSPNLIKAAEWCNKNNIFIIALVGGGRGKLSELASQTIVIDSNHYGRVEDCHMQICHMLCYAFMEREELQKMDL